MSDWTILVYMAADNGLSEYAVQDINQMESATIPSATNVIVQADFYETSTPGGAYRYKITHGVTDDIESPVIANLGEIDSGDWHNLKSFINWGFSHYPARHKALIIWSHGDSWYKGNDCKWICPDANAENIISISNGDLRNALKDSPILDVLLFDACSMQTVEVLSEVMDKATYVVGSEDIVPVYGYPYQEILPLWQGEALNIVSQIPQIYVNSYAPGGSQNPYNAIVKTTCSAIKTSFLPEFIAGLHSFGAEQDIVCANLLEARQNCLSLNSYEAEVDIKELLYYLYNHSTDTGIVASASRKLISIEAIEMAHASINYEAEIGTASIWMPTGQGTFLTYWSLYNKLPKMHLWTNLLYQLVGSPPIEIPKPEIIKAYQVQWRINLEYRLMPYPDYQSVWYRYKEEPSNPYIEFDTIDSLAYLWGDGINTQIVSIVADTYQGWLYLYTKDKNGNSSAEDSVYVSYPRDKSRMIVYPNPAKQNDILTFQWISNYANAVNSTHAKIRIYDISGKSVNVKPVKSGNTFNGIEVYTLEASKLASGVYIATAYFFNEPLRVKFAVIR